MAEEKDSFDWLVLLFDLGEEFTPAERDVIMRTFDPEKDLVALRSLGDNKDRIVAYFGSVLKRYQERMALEVAALRERVKELEASLADIDGGWSAFTYERHAVLGDCSA